MLGLYLHLFGTLFGRRTPVPTARRVRPRVVLTLTPLDERVVPDATVYENVQPFMSALTWYNENNQLLPAFPAGVTLHTTVILRDDNTYFWSYLIENQSLASPETHQIGMGVLKWGFDNPYQDLIPTTGPTGWQPTMGIWDTLADRLHWEGGDAGGILPGASGKFTTVTPVVPLLPVTALINTGEWYDWFKCPTVAPKPLPYVGIGSLLSANEAGGSPTTVTTGTFYLRRTGDLSQPLTVGVSFDSSGDYATEGADFTAPNSVTFPADDPENGIDGSTAFLTVTPKKDNIIEDEVIHAVLLPGSGYLLAPSAREADLGLTDDPPRAWATAEWASASDEQAIGRITISRSGGDVSQPLPTWVEVYGEAWDDEGEIPLAYAFTISIPAGSWSMVVDMNEGEDGSPFVAGAAPVIQTDQTNALKQKLGDGSATAVDKFVAEMQKLPQPITYQEYFYIKSVLDGSAEELADVPNSEKSRAYEAAYGFLFNVKVDWASLPAAYQSVTGGSGVWAMMFKQDVWPKVLRRVDALLPKLSSSEYDEREAATNEIRTLFNSAIQKTDLKDAATILGRIEPLLGQPNLDAEYEARLTNLIKFFKSSMYLYYYKQKKIG